MSRPLHLNHVGDRWIRKVTASSRPGPFGGYGPWWSSNSDHWACNTDCLRCHDDSCRDDKGASAASVVAKRTTLENLSLLNTQFKEADRVAKIHYIGRKAGQHLMVWDEPWDSTFGWTGFLIDNPITIPSLPMATIIG